MIKDPCIPLKTVEEMLFASVNPMNDSSLLLRYRQKVRMAVARQACALPFSMSMFASD